MNAPSNLNKLELVILVPQQLKRLGADLVMLNFLIHTFYFGLRTLPTLLVSIYLVSPRSAIPLNADLGILVLLNELVGRRRKYAEITRLSTTNFHSCLNFFLIRRLLDR